MKKKRCENAFDAVRSVIYEWDPYNLLADGAPRDEFDKEINAVVRQLERIRSSYDASHVVSRVFSSSFESETFQIENCRAVGERLYNVLIERGILE